MPEQARFCEGGEHGRNHRGPEGGPGTRFDDTVRKEREGELRERFALGVASYVDLARTYREAE